ncbi:hypothetical protein ACFXPY_32935, partial [Streptomyces sp. NPDC059153]
MLNNKGAGKRRVLTGAAAAVVAGAAFGGFALAGTAGADAVAKGGKHEPKPTVVLEHGAFADSSSWNGVISRLRGQGVPRGAPPRPPRGPPQPPPRPPRRPAPK